MSVVRPFGVGSDGDHVRDIQRRLAGLGFGAGSVDGIFGPTTEGALAEFQTAHGVDDDGICGPLTWTALVDAGYRLGDRLLYLCSPVLRGDDVSELQRRLGVLGFDTGRIDGKLGQETESALKDFQINAGLPTDGICGADTINTFRRLAPRAGTSDSNVTAVRETELIRSGFAGLRGRTVVICEPGGLDSLTAALRRALGDAGASVLTIHHPDWSMHARQANNIGADLVVALDARPGQSSVSYFSAPGVESDAGRSLAYCAVEHLEPIIGLVQPRGLRLPILRETRMPAISCRFGEMGTVVREAPRLASVLAASVVAWVSQLQSEATYPQV